MGGNDGSDQNPGRQNDVTTRLNDLTTTAGGKDRSEAGRQVDDRSDDVVRDWNLESVDRERQHRAPKIEETTGGGIIIRVFCDYDQSVDSKELRRAVIDALKQRPHYALSPSLVISVDTDASRKGKAKYNQELTEKRGYDAEPPIRSAFEEVFKGSNVLNNVEFIKKSWGESRAKEQGVADGRDRTDDRVVTIHIDPDALRPEIYVKADKPAKNDIPPQYQKDYKINQYEAEELADTPDKWTQKTKELMTDPNKWESGPWDLAKQLPEMFRQIVKVTTDGTLRWTSEMEKTDSPEDKLWKVPPPDGLRNLKDLDFFKMRVKAELEKNGYENTDAMYRKYLVHWFRKGRE